jgi:hypothetical protein
MPSDSGTLLWFGIVIVIILLLTVVNLGMTALNFKLYTEILKDQSQNRRASKGREADGQKPTT